MDVEEFLKKQHDEGIEILAILTRVPEKPHRVKVTPYSKLGGCQCLRAFELDMKQIEHVEPTGITSFCCGTFARVAKVTIHRETSIPFTDVLAMMSTNERRRQDDPEEPCSYCNEAYGRCKDRGGTEYDCMKALQACLADCLG